MEELTIKELLQVCKLYGHESPENLTIEQVYEFIRSNSGQEVWEAVMAVLYGMNYPIKPFKVFVNQVIGE